MRRRPRPSHLRVVFIGDTDLSGLDKTALTLLRRDHLGFIFQQYNLIPTSRRKENILLPLTLAGAKTDQAWFDTIVDTVGLGSASTTSRASSPVVSSSGSPSPGRSSREPDIGFADEPTGALDSRTGTEILAVHAPGRRRHRPTIVMVTHDPHAASYANNVLPGRRPDRRRMVDPTTDRVLDRMKRFEG